ncbi:protein asteroid homolog 1 [Conger conger]|uniref:protein asteroid homolog 1 n=1 Tax=Conger conger TaxID=82655 RepID=UPI002A5ABECB|nr:protein asteroid homolog 1 [Conger conger]
MLLTRIMWIQDFTTYVAGSTHFFIDLQLKNTKLVIDGNSLYRRLYLASRFDHQHGGEYDSFARRIQHFFRVLFLCNISPFVVLDSSMDQSDKKFKILKQRAQTNITVAHALSTGSRGTILPVLGKTVFRQVLSELKVPFVQCIADASREIASLANQWNCAVLTMNSIFYIFDLKGGCIHTNDFGWDKVNECKKTSERHIDARLFSINRFCEHFNHMNKELLPLFATMVGHTAMAGHDFTKLHKIMETFFIQAKFPERPHTCKDRTHDCIDSLLHWLAQFTDPQVALKGVLEVIGGAHKLRYAHSLLSSGMKQYSLSVSNLIPFFTEGATLSNLPNIIGDLPPWILLALAKGELGFFVQNVLVLQRVMLHTQVEDFQLPSCNTTSQPIRQVLYSLLLDGKQGLTQTGPRDARVNLCSTNCVQEFEREGLFLKQSTVPAVLTKTVLHLPLESLNKVRKLIRLKVLLDTLEVKRSLLSLVPPHLHLTVCVTCYWLSHAEPQPDLQHLQALLVGFVFGELNKVKTKEGKKEWSQDLAAVWKRLNKLRMKIDRKGPDPGAAHTFSQWQSCMRMSLLLNQLLCVPLPEPGCAWLYRGTLVHQVLKMMKEGNAPKDLLQGACLPGQLFRDLMGAVQSSVGGDFFMKQRKSTRRQAHKQQINLTESPQSTEDSFAQPECDDENENDDNYDDDNSDDEQEEEVQYWEPACSVRVRFRTTSRTTRYRERVRMRKPARVMW